MITNVEPLESGGFIITFENGKILNLDDPIIIELRKGKRIPKVGEHMAYLDNLTGFFEEIK